MGIEHLTQERFDKIVYQIDKDAAFNHVSRLCVEQAVRQTCALLHITIGEQQVANYCDSAYGQQGRTEEAVTASLADAFGTEPKVTVEVNDNSKRHKDDSPFGWIQKLMVGARIVCHVYPDNYLYFSGKGKKWTTLDLQRMLPQLTALATHHRLDDGTTPMIYPGKVVSTYAGIPMTVLSTNGPEQRYPFVASSPGGTLLYYDRFGRLITGKHNDADLALHGAYKPLTSRAIYDSLGRTVRQLKLGGERSDLVFEIVGMRQTPNLVAEIQHGSGAWSCIGPDTLLGNYVWHDGQDAGAPVGTLVDSI